MTLRRHAFVCNSNEGAQIAGENCVFKTMMGHVAPFFWGMLEARWSSGPEGGCKYTRAGVQSIRRGPTGHTWLHQSLSVFEECTGPPPKGYREGKFKDVLQMHRQPITNQENGAEKLSGKTRKTKDSCWRNLVLWPYGGMWNLKAITEHSINQGTDTVCSV